MTRTNWRPMTWREADRERLRGPGRRAHHRRGGVRVGFVAAAVHPVPPVSRDRPGGWVHVEAVGPVPEVHGQAAEAEDRGAAGAPRAEGEVMVIILAAHGAHLHVSSGGFLMIILVVVVVAGRAFGGGGK